MMAGTPAASRRPGSASLPPARSTPSPRACRRAAARGPWNPPRPASHPRPSSRRLPFSAASAADRSSSSFSTVALATPSTSPPSLRGAVGVVERGLRIEAEHRLELLGALGGVSNTAMALSLLASTSSSCSIRRRRHPFVPDPAPTWLAASDGTTSVSIGCPPRPPRHCRGRRDPSHPPVLAPMRVGADQPLGRLDNRFPQAGMTGLDQTRIRLPLAARSIPRCQPANPCFARAK